MILHHTVYRVEMTIKVTPIKPDFHRKADILTFPDVY